MCNQCPKPTTQDSDTFGDSVFQHGPLNILTCPVEIQKAKDQIAKRFPERFIHFYMDTAVRASQLSYCKRLQTGATLVTPHNEMFTGYNGTVSGMPNVCENPGQDKTDPRTLHAESNTIAKVTNSTLSSINSTLFTTHCCCVECAKLVIQCKARRVFYLHDYRLDDGLRLMVDSRVGVQVIRLKMVDGFYSIDRIHNHFTPYVPAY